MTVTHQEVVAEFYRAFNRRDLDSAEENLAPEFAWTNLEGGQERGRAAFRAYWLSTWAKNDVRIEPIDMQVVGDKVHARVQQVVTAPGGVILDNRKMENIFGFDGVFIASIVVIDRDPNPDADDEDEDEDGDDE